MNFQKKTKYYPCTVYEFNLPAGHSCPYADECKVLVNRETGKMDMKYTRFRCYAAMSERFPAVRRSRWENFNAIEKGEKIEIPKKATHIRIHASGDFYCQDYFDQWLEVCRENPSVIFWAFTKSVQFWVNRLNEIPENFTLQASKGGLQDNLIDEYKLKYAEVFQDHKKIPNGMLIDTDDSLAMQGENSFALLDNHKYNREEQKRIAKINI